MTVSVLNISDWSCEDTCDWFKSFGFNEPEETELFICLRRYKINASLILEMKLSYIEDLCGTSDAFKVKVYQIKVKELNIRDQQEKRNLQTITVNNQTCKPLLY